MNSNEILGIVLTFIFSILVIPFVLFKFFGERWIESRFSKQIKEHEFRLQSIFDKRSIVQKKEVEVLPEIWRLLHQTIHAIENNSEIKKRWDNNKIKLDEYSEIKLNLYLKNSNIDDFRIDIIKNSKNKEKEFKKIVILEDLVKTKRFINEFSKYLAENYIFINYELATHLSKVDDKLRNIFNFNQILIRDDLKNEELDEIQDCFQKKIKELTPLFALIYKQIKKELLITE